MKENLKFIKMIFSLPFKHLLIVILTCTVSVLAKAQNQTITGKVFDNLKTPLSGVTIAVKGSNVTTQTNFDGTYKIKAEETDILVFKYVGFITKSIKIDKRTTIDVALESSTTNLDEIIVVGYGTQKRKDITGAVSKVSMKDIEKAPVRSFDEALAGRIAGVQVSSSDGRPGGGVNIVIRGNNSVTQDNSPLYVIDGFLIENSNNNIINPQDIQSMEILKDASATAIYGSRGANGVIVITTKKGKQGKAEFNFSTSIGFQQNVKKMELMSPYEFVKYQLEIDPALTSTTSYKTPTEVYLSDGKTLDYYKTQKTTDWQDMVMRTAAIKTYNMGISGGNKDTKYAFSGSMTDQDGILLNSNYKRYQGRLVIDQNFTKNLKIGINTNYSHLEQAGINPSASNSSATSNFMVSVWGAKPVNNPGNDDLLLDPDINPANDYRVNPYLNITNLYRLNTTKNLSSNAYLEYQFIPGLKLRVTSGIIENRIEQEAFNNSKTQYGYPGNTNGVNGSIRYSQSSNWLNENTLTWNKKFKKKNDFNALGGFTLQKQENKNYGYGATQLPNESLGLDGLYQGIPMKIDTFESIWTMASFLGRVTYSYDSKYIITASYRADGSSKFPTENHWGYFPSGAVSWKFNNENFLKNFKPLSEGKLRLSYGVTGNNRVGDFDYLTMFYTPIGNSYVFNNTYINGAVPINLGNTKLKWETTEQVNLGVDLGFFDQRLTLSADLYRKVTKDLLLNANLPLSTGYSNAKKNVGSVQNQGLEITLNTININTKNFNWTTNFNIAFNQSKLIALAEGQQSIESRIGWDTQWEKTYGYISTLGQPLGQMQGFISEGTYKYTDFDKDTNGKYILKSNVTTNGNTRANIQPGDIKYKDLNGDLVVNSSDYTVIGRGTPLHTGGFNNNFTYKNFDLGVFFEWSYGNDILNANRILFDGNTKNQNYLNQFASYENRWTPENPDSNVFRTKGFVGGGYSSQFIEDGSYLRLKTVSFGYNLNPEFLKRFYLKSLRFYVSGQNLFTWTKYTGIDPEVNTYSSALTPGFDFSAYPRARTIAFGTNILF